VARTVDPKTGGLTFERRADVPRGFDIARPAWADRCFELPEDVDFYFVFARHDLASDFDMTLAMMEGMDNFLLESPEIKKGVRARLDSLVSDNPKDSAWLDRNSKHVKRECTGFERRLMKGLRRYKPKLVYFDPPKKHAAYDDNMEVHWYRMGADDELEGFDDIRLQHMLIDRDRWCLENIKQLIDSAIPYTKGERRQVLMHRGYAHYGLGNALGWQIEYRPDLARGCTLTQTVVLAGTQGSDGEPYFSEAHERLINQISTRT
jgi:hypothetical protein